MLRHGFLIVCFQLENKMQVKHVPEVTKTVVEQEEQYVLTLTKPQAQAIRALLRHVRGEELLALGMLNYWGLPNGTTAWDSNEGRSVVPGPYLPAMSFKPSSDTLGAPDAS
jgi:hypothetical protein